MKPLLISVSVLALTTGAFGQKTIAVPTGHSLETNEGYDQFATGWGGAAYTLYFGTYADQRHQLITNDLAGGGIKLITQIDFRPDWKSFSTSNGMGRSWSNVGITLAETAFASVSSTFAGNLTSNVSAVFSGAVAWPTQNGRPSTNSPAPWGTKGLAFPLKQVYPYSGKTNALVQEFQFQNGTLANNGAWGGTTRVSYDLDGVFTTLSFSQSAGGPGNRNCVDSAFTPSSSVYAQDSGQLNVYSNVYPGSQAGTLAWRFASRYTAPGQPVLHCLSLGAPVSVNIGAKCNSLHCNLASFYILQPNTANNNSTASTPGILMSYQRSAVPFGTRVTAQTAWSDSKTGQFGLTTAKDHTLRNTIWLSDSPPQWKSVWRYNLTSTTGQIGNLGSTSYYNPVTLYTHR